jgi:PPOX class probable F420-dependent enzyme
MESADMRKRLAQAQVAHLATAGADGRPHVVPITFATGDDVLYFAVDAKPKRTTNLKRLQNIAANPAVSVLVDHYEDDWNKLWWVRVDGTAHVITDLAEAEHAIEMLTKRYPQYRRARPNGPVVAISVDRITGWSSE